MSNSPLKTDPLLTPFTSPTFSPITYLNSTLPTLPPLTTTSTTTKPPPPSSSLTTLTTQTRTQITTLSAQTARLSTTLTALTDDILRISSRLAYEVELLRGEAQSLSESLSAHDEEREDGLGAAMRVFLPLAQVDESQATPQMPPPSQTPAPTTTNPTLKDGTASGIDETISHLRTLLHVRSRLTLTTQTFSTALSLPTTANEEKERTLRREISDLLTLGGSEGEKRARERIAELRDVVRVWKGTGEEKARGKVVDGLEGMVDEVVGGRQRGGGATTTQRRAAHAQHAGGEMSGGDSGGGSGRGFLGGLAGLRG